MLLFQSVLIGPTDSLIQFCYQVSKAIGQEKQIMSGLFSVGWLNLQIKTNHCIKFSKIFIKFIDGNISLY